MNKILLTILFIVSLCLFSGAYSSSTSLYYYSEYYGESIEGFISSPNYSDLQYISDEIQQYCEEVYLEATRRREYTEMENLVCFEVFAIKRQQELDYINYMYRNRGIY